MKHPEDRLSAFLDGELADSERSAVTAHLAQCPACRAKIDDSKDLSHSLSSLPRRPLPPGFMHRLNARRAAEQAPAWGFGDWSPRVRTAAFALSGVAVAFVAMEGLRERPVPTRLSFDAGIIGAAKNDIPETSIRADAAPAKRQGAREEKIAGKRSALAAVRGAGDGGLASFGGAGSGGGAGLKAKAPAAKAAPEVRGRAPGAPYGEPMPVPQPSFKNDSQQEFLADEKDRMGIKQIVSPGAGYARPIGFAAAERRIKLGREVFPAALAGATPGLLAEESRAAFAPGAPAQPDTSWNIPSEPEGTVIKTQAELEAFWKRMGGTPPTIDFTRQMLVVVLAGPATGLTASISSVQPSGGRLVVRYRLAVGADKGAIPYPMQTLPRSDLPVVFEEAP